jgi:hypothetical protein
MLGAAGGVEDVDGHVPHINPLLQEGDQDLVFFVRALEERTDMAARFDQRVSELQGPPN